jgi:hypothetical protein
MLGFFRNTPASLTNAHIFTYMLNVWPGAICPLLNLAGVPGGMAMNHPCYCRNCLAVALSAMLCVLTTDGQCNRTCALQDVVTANPETWTFDPFTLKVNNQASHRNAVFVQLKIQSAERLRVHCSGQHMGVGSLRGDSCSGTCVLHDLLCSLLELVHVRIVCPSNS